jgi:hypothetical protein
MIKVQVWLDDVSHFSVKNSIKHGEPGTIVNKFIACLNSLTLGGFNYEVQLL